jgi:hypothetical protein
MPNLLHKLQIDRLPSRRIEREDHFVCTTVSVQ